MPVSIKIRTKKPIRDDADMLLELRHQWGSITGRLKLKKYVKLELVGFSRIAWFIKGELNSPFIFFVLIIILVAYYKVVV